MSEVKSDSPNDEKLAAARATGDDVIFPKDPLKREAPNLTSNDVKLRLNRKMLALFALAILVGIGSWLGAPLFEKRLVVYNKQIDNISMTLNGVLSLTLDDISSWNTETISHINSFYDQNTELSIRDMKSTIVAENRTRNGYVQMIYAQLFTYKAYDDIYTATQLATLPFETLAKKSYVTTLQNIGNAFKNIDVEIGILEGILFSVNNLQMRIDGSIPKFDEANWQRLTTVHIKDHFNRNNGKLGVIVSRVLTEITEVTKEMKTTVVSYNHPELSFRAKNANVNAEEIVLLPFGDTDYGRADYIQSLQKIVAFQNIKHIEAIAVTRNPSTVPSVYPTVSLSPSSPPSRAASKNPSQNPSRAASEIPSQAPSRAASNVPSRDLSSFPSIVPSTFPSRALSSFPSIMPSTSSFPSGAPSFFPSSVPSVSDSTSPTVAPSASLSTHPTISTSPTVENLEFKLELTTDGYGDDTSWTVINTDNNVVVAFNESYDSSTAFSEKFLLPRGRCYKFTISDTANDGICCSYGNGGFSVSIDGIVLDSGGNFGTFASVTFGNCDAKL